MNTPWINAPELPSTIPAMSAKCLFLYLCVRFKCGESAVPLTVQQAAKNTGVSPGSVQTAISWLVQNGYIVPVGSPKSRSFSLPTDPPKAVLDVLTIGTRVLTIDTGVPITDTRVLTISTSPSEGSEIREGDTLLGGSKSKSLKVLSHTTTVGASFPSPTEVTASSAGEMRLSAIAEIRSYEGEFFSLFGRLVSADELDLLVEQWQAAHKYAGRFPNRTEVTDAIKWLKSKPYPKTPKAFITAMGAIKEVRDGSGQESTRPVGGTGRTPGVPTDKARERLARWMAESPNAKQIAEENAAVAAGNW